MGFKNIDKHSIGYLFTKKFVQFFHDLIFYRKIEITGKENWEMEKPMIYAPNHQNALMDPMHVIFSQKKQPIFLARSDIFQNPISASFLYFAKVLPVYRIRDGKEKLSENDRIFMRSVEALKNCSVIALFPEAQHNNRRQLLPVKKGVQRIAFQAEEVSNYELGIQIIPIGINYSNYWIFKSKVLVIVGKPIPVSEFLDEYKENQQKAYLSLRNRISVEIKKLIIDIQNNEFFDLYENIMEIYDKPMMDKLNDSNKPLLKKFRADKKIIASLDIYSKDNNEKLKVLESKTENYIKGLKKFRTRDWVLEKNESGTKLSIKLAGIILLFPVFIYGFVQNILPFIASRPITNKLEDNQFTASIAFVLSLFIFFPIFYAILFAIASQFIDIWWIKLTYMVSLPLAGTFAFDYYEFSLRTFSQFRIFFNRKKQAVSDLFNLRADIIKEVDQIIEFAEKEELRSNETEVIKKTKVA